MNPRLLERIYNQEKTPITLHGWQMAAIEVEQQQRECSSSGEEALGLKIHIQQRPGGQQYPSQGWPADYTPHHYNTNSPQTEGPQCDGCRSDASKGGESYMLQLWKRGPLQKHNALSLGKAQRARNTELSYGENDEYIQSSVWEMRKRGINGIGLLLDNGQSGFCNDGQ